MTDQPLSITGVTRDTAAKGTAKGSDYEYRFVLQLSRNLSSAERNSSALFNTGLEPSPKTPDKLTIRATTKDLEAHLGMYQSAMPAIEAEGRERDEEDLQTIERVKAAQDQQAAQLQETLDRVNKKLNG